MSAIKLPPSDNREVNTMSAERSSLDLDTVEKLINILNGDQRATDLRRHCYDIVKNDPILNDGHIRYVQSMPEIRERSVRKIIRAAEILRTRRGDREFELAFRKALDQHDRGVGMRIFVHYDLFMATIRGQGTEEQQKWVERAERLQVTGCFGMTEIEHSSYLRGLETIATYIVGDENKNDEIIIQSGSIRSTKLWIGQGASTASHCVVYTRLLVSKKGEEPQDCGLQLFIVPLRDIETGENAPGVTTGDLGPKAGRDGLDNGWIRFDQVRVPRSNMLMKWAQLDRDGTFTPPPNPALVYGATITERVASVPATSVIVEPALVTGIRFSTVRRQGKGDPQLIDYPTQQLRLIPALACMYALRFTTLQVIGVHRYMLKQLQGGDEIYYLGGLADIHAIGCGLKPVATWMGADILEAVRRSMGGAAYMKLSGIPTCTADFGLLTTGGGDNIVIAQQTSSYLLKVFKKGAPSFGRYDSIEYLVNLLEKKKKAGGNKGDAKKKLVDATSAESVLNPEFVLDVFAELVVELGEAAVELLAQQPSGSHKVPTWDVNAPELVELTLAHSYRYMVDSFFRGVSTLPEGTPEKAVNLLKALSSLFALVALQKFSPRMVEVGVAHPSILKYIREATRDLCLQIRPYVIPLTDAFDTPDFIINAPLGEKDGDIYYKMLKAMTELRGGTGVPHYWEDLLKPLFHQPIDAKL